MRTGGARLHHAATPTHAARYRTTAGEQALPALSMNDAVDRRATTRGVEVPLPAASGAPIRQLPLATTDQLGPAVGLTAPPETHVTVATLPDRARVDASTIHAPNERLDPLRPHLECPRDLATLGR